MRVEQEVSKRQTLIFTVEEIRTILYNFAKENGTISKGDTQKQIVRVDIRDYSNEELSEDDYDLLGYNVLVTKEIEFALVVEDDNTDSPVQQTQFMSL